MPFYFIKSLSKSCIRLAEQLIRIVKYSTQVAFFIPYRSRSKFDSSREIVCCRFTRSLRNSAATHNKYKETYTQNEQTVCVLKIGRKHLFRCRLYYIHIHFLRICLVIVANLKSLLLLCQNFLFVPSLSLSLASTPHKKAIALYTKFSASLCV